MSDMTRVALDAMGGDNAPQAIVAGVEAARDKSGTIFRFCSQEKKRY